MKKIKKGLLLTLIVTAIAMCGSFFMACKTEKVVTLTPTTATVEVGEKITLKALVDGEPSSEIVWATDKAAVATVKDGVVSGVSEGTAKITATVGKSVAECVITVKPMVTINVDPTAITLAVGKNATIQYTIVGSTGSAVWSSDAPSIATVSNEGVVTAVASGVANISATINGKVATCVVTVVDVSITLDKASLSLYDDGVTATLVANVVNSTDTVVWASEDTAIATVAAGVVTPITAGTTKITATVNGKIASCNLTVKAVTISVEATATAYMTKTLQLTANIGEYIGEVVWSTSAAAVATVDNTGLVETVSAGSATISATVGGKTATCALTVKAVPTLSFGENGAMLDVSALTAAKSVTPTLTVSDETAPELVWTTSEASVATVNEGVITARGAGSAVITANFNGFTADFNVTVKDYTGYKLIQTANQFLNIAKNNTANYVLGNDVDFNGAHIDKPITDLNGILDGNGYSVKNFVVGAKNAEDYKKYDVWGNPIQWKGLFGSNLGTIKNIAFTGAKGYFNGNNCAVLVNANVGLIENVLLETEINYEGGSKGIGGIASLNWTNEGKTGVIRNCVVIASSSLGCKGLGAAGDKATDEWGKASQGLIVGQLSSGEIKNCYTASKPTEYSSELVCGGNMVGIGCKNADGTARPDYKQLTAEDNCANKTLDELKSAALFGDSWNKDIWNIVEGSQPSLKNAGKTAPTIVEFLETDTTFTNNKLTVKAVVNTTDEIVYSSSDTAIAEIDAKTGVITALSVGTVTITAKVGEITDTKEITIVLVWSDLTEKRLKETTRETLVYDASPDATITWLSSDGNKAIVDSGVVVAVGDGKFSITATINGKKAVLNTLSAFTVKINLDKTTGDVFVGKTIKLTATTEETTETVVWASLDTAIATVDQNGLVTGVKVGFADITATVEGKTATCKVEVKAEPAFKLNKDSADLYIIDGKAETLDLDVVPNEAGAVFEAVWTSSDTAVATVDSNGVVTLLKAGTAKIRATVADIYYKEATITVKLAKGIATAANFLDIKKDATANYVLTADIDFKNVFVKDLGEFNGLLDGRGYKIHNFTLGKATLQEWLALDEWDWSGKPSSSCGLFSQNFGTIKNIAMTNVVSFAGYYFGIISSNNYGTIENVLIESEFYSRSWGVRDAGGISGTNGTSDGKTGVIRNCIVKLTAKSHKAMKTWIKSVMPEVGDKDYNGCGFTAGCVDGGIPNYGASVQGLITGLINAGTVENCYATTTRIWNDGETATADDIFGGNLFGTWSKTKPESNVKKEVADLTSAALFGDSWNKDIWNIVEGSQPSLKK